MTRFRHKIMPALRKLARAFYRDPVFEEGDRINDHGTAVPFPEGPVPVPETGDDIAGFATKLLGKWHLLRPVLLEEPERHRLSGSLFIGGPLLVYSVAGALRDHPDLFPDGAIRAASLLARQVRATGWLFLKTSLEGLLREASDSYLHEQATANEEALAVLEKIRYRAQDPDAPAEWTGPGGLIALQKMAMSGAVEVLRRRQQKKRRVMLRNRREQGKPAPQRRGKKDSGPGLEGLFVLQGRLMETWGL